MLSTLLDLIPQSARSYSPAMQIAIYSSISGGGSVGNGACEEMFFAGNVALRNWASTSGRLSPAGAITADAADCFACLDREVKVLRNRPSSPALNHIKNRRTQKMMTPTTRLDR